MRAMAPSASLYLHALDNAQMLPMGLISLPSRPMCPRDTRVPLCAKGEIVVKRACCTAPCDEKLSGRMAVTRMALSCARMGVNLLSRGFFDKNKRQASHFRPAPAGEMLLVRTKLSGEAS